MQPSWRRGAGIAAILLLIVLWAVIVASFSRMVGQWPIAGNPLTPQTSGGRHMRRTRVRAGTAPIWIDKPQGYSKARTGQYPSEPI